MPVQLEHPEEGLLVVHARGKLTKDDYAAYLPAVEHIIQQHGTVNILFDLQDFHGWEPGAAWEDVRFSWHHSQSVERLAFVCDQRWLRFLALLARPFTHAQVRYFTREEIQSALQWTAHSTAAP